MKKATFTTLILLLLCGVWAVAQRDNPSDQANQSGSSGKTTVQGCLSRSETGYTLTDKSGTTYQLTGETSQLSAHVGHEVQIKGTKTEAGAAAGTTSGTASRSVQPQLEVSSMKHIAETCSTRPKSEKENPPLSEKPPVDRPPMSEKPPIPDKPPTALR